MCCELAHFGSGSLCRHRRSGIHKPARVRSDLGFLGTSNAIQMSELVDKCLAPIEPRRCYCRRQRPTRLEQVLVDDAAIPPGLEFTPADLQRRFTRDAPQHPTYQALAELGKAV